MNELWNYIQHNLATNDLAAAGAITASLSAVLVTVGMYARQLPSALYRYIKRRLLFTLTVEHTDPLYEAISWYLQQNYAKDFRKVEASSIIDYELTDSEGEYRTLSRKTNYESPIQLKSENDFIVIYRDYRRIVVSSAKEKLENNNSELFRKSYLFSGLLAKSQILSLVEDIRKEFKSHEDRKKLEAKKVFLKTHSSHGYWETTSLLSGKTFEDLFFSSKENLRNDLEYFIQNRDLYSRLKIPFKRGYLFYGLPGNGKSATVFAIADYLKYDVYSLTLSSLYKESFTKTISKIPPNSILLIEDIDAYYDKRKPSEENKISFAQFINALSGLDNKENIITIFTTNYIDKIDSALLRDGRCDRKIYFENPSKREVEMFLTKIYKEKITLFDYTPDKSFAHVQNIVLKNIDNLPKLKELLC